MGGGRPHSGARATAGGVRQSFSFLYLFPSEDRNDEDVDVDMDEDVDMDKDVLQVGPLH